MPSDLSAPTSTPEDLARRQEDLWQELRDVRSRTNGLQRRLSTIEQDYVRLTEAVATRSRAATAAPASEPSAPPPPRPKPSQPPPSQAPPAVTPLPPPASPRPPAETFPPAAASATRPRLDAADLFGARALAWAGGAVTALGVVLLFVFAVDRGWITPELRVGFGALASALVFAAGLELRRRYGAVHSALGAVGAGIAGGYATLLAATQLYGLVPEWAALALASLIASIGAATAISWRSELVAGIGLIGAMVVPLVAVPDVGFTTLGIAFVSLVFARTAMVATRLQWPRLLWLGMVLSAGQVTALLLAGDVRGEPLFAAEFALLFATAALAYQRSVDRQGLSGLAASLVLTSAGVATLAASVFTDEGTIAGGLDEEGAVFALVALAYAAAGALLYASARSRPLRRLLGAAGLAGSRPLAVLFAAVGLTLGGHALAELVSGRPLALAFALQAVLLAWLARRISDRRFQLGALTYLGLAAGHALLVDAPRTFFADPHAHPAVGVPSLVAAALAAVAVARFSGGWPHRADQGAGLRFLDPLLADLTTLSRGVRALLVAGALALATYAGALTVLETGQWLGDDLVASFEWSHVAISVLLAAGGLAATLVPLHRWRTFVTAAAAGALGTAALKVGAFDLERLADPPRGIAALSVGLALAVAALALVRRSTLHGDALGLVALAVALPLEVAGSIVLTERASWNGLDAPALALLGLTLVHACLAAVSFMRPYGRNHSTAQGFVALVLGGVAIHGLLDGLPRTLVLAAVGTGLAALAVAVRERRLLPAALAYEIVAACYAITLEGPPAHLFAVHEHPGAGLPALLAALGGALALLAAERRTADAERRLPERVERAVSDLVPAWLWGLGVGAVYAASLAILELAEILLTGSVEADFQRGHTAVSAFWALVGVVLLHAGLVRGRRVLRTAGFAALGITLVKIFAYDLANLPAATRSVSFLAVGALLLVAGFFYQRLAAAAAERHGNRRGDGVPEPSGL